MKKLRFAIAALAMTFWQSAQAIDQGCEEEPVGNKTATEENAPVVLEKAFIRSLNKGQKDRLYRSMNDSSVDIDKSDWEEVDIDEWEEIITTPLTTNPTVE